MIVAYLLSNNNIENEIYNIEYETIEDLNCSENTFDLQQKISELIRDLDDSDKNKCFNSLNEYYYSFAIDYIDEWYKKSGLDEKKDFLKYIKENVKVIWYELSDDNEENENETFIRINTNKIKLTQADLVKAEFLREDKNREKETNLMELGKEWDDIENSLFNQKFWFFISDKDTEDRMSQLLNITMNVYYDIEDNDGEDENEIYNTFQKQIDSSIIKTWKNVKTIYNILNEWYEDIDIYNIIGYLIMREENKKNDVTKWIVDAVKKYTKTKEIKSKEEFKKTFLIKKIKENVYNPKDNGKNDSRIDKKELKEYIENINYLENPNEIKNILILHNILTLNELKENKVRFAFDKYKNSYDDEGKKIKWDIEHIHSQHEKEIKFIPICTKKAFLKAFITNIDSYEEENNIMQFFEWNLEDSKTYINDITDKLYEGIYKEG